ncbi:hypothetical protein BDZ91DRAFT_319675 [Kalaharituber pfeilii]|nr:hypothetical protein BDZ91DRAFT_319675 [Kalaharituber pfeilii]
MLLVVAYAAFGSLGCPCRRLIPAYARRPHAPPPTPPSPMALVPCRVLAYHDTRDSSLPQNNDRNGILWPCVHLIWLVYIHHEHSRSPVPTSCCGGQISRSSCTCNMQKRR